MEKSKRHFGSWLEKQVGKREKKDVSWQKERKKDFHSEEKTSHSHKFVFFFQLQNTKAKKRDAQLIRNQLYNFITFV